MPPPNTEDFLFESSPETFGPFRVLHQIGAGVLGPVFRTHQVGRDRLVAVKVFRIDLAPDHLRVLETELGRLVTLKLAHPSIVTALASGVEGGAGYLAQEYVAADSLDVAVRQLGPLPIEDVLRIVAQLAGALDVSAAAGVSHGMLHLRDVLVRDGDARLTGLGIARALEAAGAVPPIRRAYTAPERRQAGNWGRAADVYSLAAIAHELLFGRRLPGGPEDAATSLRETAGAGSSLVEVLATALSVNPAERHDTAAGFARELNRAATHPPRTASSGHRAAMLDEADARSARESGGEFSLVEPREPRDPMDEAIAMAAPEPRAELTHTLFDLHGDPEQATDAVAPGRGIEEPVLQHTALADHEAFGADDTPMIWFQQTVQADAAARERAPWTIWAAIAALVLVVGAGTYVAMRARPSTSEDRATSVASREWTESKVSEAVPPTTPPAAPSSTPTPAPRPVAPVPAVVTGRLLVRSTPAGAVVTINGERRGTTPLAIREMSLGTYTVQVARPGFRPVQRRVSLTNDRPSSSLALTLSTAAPARAAAAATVKSGFGSLAVLTRPAGAMVYLDGRAIGRTPMVVAQIAPGSHAIRFELDGHRQWATTVQVSAGERSRVAASLERGGSR